MRTLVVVLLTLVSLNTASAETLWNVNIAKWHVGAYSFTGTRTFSHCGAAASYRSGIILVFAIDKKFGWSMGFANPNWRLQPHSKYDVAYWVDDDPASYTTAMAISRDQVVVTLRDSVPLFNAFRRGRVLHVRAERARLEFNLTDTSTVLAYLLKCASARGIKPEPIIAADPNPFGSRNASPPQKAPAVVPTVANSSEALRSEATVLAANLISELGITGFKFLRADELPAGFKGDAVWRTAGGFGTVTILPDVSDDDAIRATIIGADAKACKKAFASGALPAEAGSTVDRLFTKCGSGAEALVAYYLVVPRKATGRYVIGTYSIGEERAAESVDTQVRTAVFRALPK